MAQSVSNRGSRSAFTLQIAKSQVSLVVCGKGAIHMKKILLGSPIHQKPQILKEFLTSIDEIEKDGFSLDCFFIDDNEITESSTLLKEFAKKNEGIMRTIILKSDNIQSYVCNEITHNWNEELVWKVAKFKDEMIIFAKNNDYDYLFLVDSDIVLHPKTISHLISTGKDIISEIFWTNWMPGQMKLPQVWIQDTYTLYRKSRGEKLTESQIIERTLGFINQLKIPGVYEVGGLGGCTLISKKALCAGVSFKEIKNVSFWGEDRHFCIRAQALGFDLFVDTHYPAYHIYRESDLQGVSLYKRTEKEKPHVLKCLKEGLEKLGTFNYKNDNSDDSWKEFFTEERAMFIDEIAKIENPKNRERKISVTATVFDIQVLSWNEQGDNCTCSFKLRNVGLLDTSPFEETFTGEAMLAKINGKWKICEFNILT